MRIAIKKLITDHNQATGKKLSQASLARELVDAGVFKSFESARNMIQYNITGKAQSLDVPLLEYLQKRFKKDLNQIIQS